MNFIIEVYCFIVIYLKYMDQKAAIIALFCILRNDINHLHEILLLQLIAFVFKVQWH